MLANQAALRHDGGEGHEDAWCGVVVFCRTWVSCQAAGSFSGGAEGEGGPPSCCAFGLFGPSKQQLEEEGATAEGHQRLPWLCPEWADESGVNVGPELTFTGVPFAEAAMSNP